MASLKARWGSGVIRHIDVFGEELRECGRAILRGLRRCWSVKNFFPVRTSHIASESEGPASEDSTSIARRFFVEEAASCC